MRFSSKLNAIVVTSGLSDVDLLLGQPALQGDVVLVVSGGTATLSRAEPSVLTSELDVEAMVNGSDRYQVRACSDVLLAPGSTTMVNVRVVGADPGTEVFVGSRSHEERGTWIAVPNVVIYHHMENNRWRYVIWVRSPCSGRQIVCWRELISVILVTRHR
ncbi:hypothetical protein L9F63_001708 [Diploptera punctata]|uniref:Uncharacterized protein n=1 Tax=Diploptera punctata TaxID=6984 RepID=A0AAD8A3I2_DIPPU|nr:hypothetical protein L9F63_001708 [Diploptera punctata]